MLAGAGLVVMASSLLAAPTAAPCLEKAILSRAGQDGFTRYRIPGIVVTSKGTALAYCEARKHTRQDFGEIEIHLCRFAGGGRTWSPARQIAHLGQRMKGNPRKQKGGETEQIVNNPVAVLPPQRWHLRCDVQGVTRGVHRNDG